MSEATYAGGLPPAGWYPDPDVPGQARWWDGTQWYASQPVLRPRLDGGFSRLATVLVWLIALQGVVYVGLMALYAWGHFNLPEDRMFESSFTTYDLIDSAGSALTGLLFLGSLIVWCLWQHRLAAATPREHLRRSPGMHVGSWFIPIVMLWFPLQNMRDLWRSQVGRLVPGLLGGWWLLWLITHLSGQAVVLAVLDVDSSSRAVNDVSLVDAAFWPGMCAIAVVIVRRLSKAALDREADRLSA